MARTRWRPHGYGLLRLRSPAHCIGIHFPCSTVGSGLICCLELCMFYHMHSTTGWDWSAAGTKQTCTLSGLWLKTVSLPAECKT